jgi:iron complex outermembrane receptor protein
MLDPSTTPTAKIKASYGSYNKMNLSAYGSSPVTDSVTADISGYKETTDGYVKNTFTGKDDDGEVDRWGARASAIWEVNNDISFKLAVDHHDWDDGTVNSTSSLDGQSLSAVVPIPGIQIARKPKRVSNDGETVALSEIDGIYLTSRFALGDIDLTSYTMGRNEKTKQILDLDGSSITAFHNFFDIENKSLSQEFNLSGNAFDDKLDWIAGLYYLQVDEDYTDLEVQSAINSIPNFATLYNVASKIETYAVFTDMTYNFSDEWMLTLGARYSYESADGMINIAEFGAPGFNGLLMLPAGKTYLDDSWGSFTPRAVLAYKPDNRSKVYASVGKGFKAGQISPSSLLPVTSVDPEEILAYEVGYKFADSTFRFDAAVFYYDYKDMQVASYNAVSAIVSNAATSTIYGAEAQASFIVADDWTVNLGGAYVHGEYDDYTTAPYFVQTPSGTYADIGANGTGDPRADASGNQMQRSPKFTGNIGLQYETPIPVGTVRFNTDYYYTSSFYFDPANQNKQDAYGLLNLAASWIDPSEKWTLSLYSKNALNKVYRNQVLAGAFAIQQTYGEPATYGASVIFKY